MHQPLLVCLLAGLSVTAAACGDGDDVVSHSAPVGIHLAFSSGDVAGGRVGDDKNINTESGNPYGAFMSEARDVLGRDPGRIEVDSLTLTVTAASSGVTTLGAIYDGPTDLAFEMNGSGTIVPVASLDIGPTTTGGPVPMVIAFNSGSVSGGDWESLVGGSFKVLIGGPAQGDFEGASASIDLEALFVFDAIE